MPSACVSASLTPNVPNRKSLNFQERRLAVENVEGEEVERVENAESFLSGRATNREPDRTLSSLVHLGWVVTTKCALHQSGRWANFGLVIPRTGIRSPSQGRLSTKLAGRRSKHRNSNRCATSGDESSFSACHLLHIVQPSFAEATR